MSAPPEPTALELRVARAMWVDGGWAPDAWDRPDCATFRDNYIKQARVALAAAGVAELLASLEGLCGLAAQRPGHLHEYKAAVEDARAAIAAASPAGAP